MRLPDLNVSQGLEAPGGGAAAAGAAAPSASPAAEKPLGVPFDTNGIAPGGAAAAAPSAPPAAEKPLSVPFDTNGIAPGGDKAKTAGVQATTVTPSAPQQADAMPAVPPASVPPVPGIPALSEASPEASQAAPVMRTDTPLTSNGAAAGQGGTGIPPETLSLQGQNLGVPGLPPGQPQTGGAPSSGASLPVGSALPKPPQGPNPDPSQALKQKNKESDISDAYKYRPETSPANTKQYSVQNLHLPQVQYESEYIRLFFDAVAADDMDAVRALHSYFKTPEFRDDHMNTPLLYSAMLGKKRMVETLLGMGANPNNYNAYRVTPLMVAAKSGRSDLVNLLLHFNAMPNLADRHGHTALMYASSANSAECVMMLAKYGAELNATRFSDSSSALHLAVHYNAPLAVEMLLKHGADPDILNTHRITPLMLAANYNYGDIAATLLRYQANPQLVDRKGRTAENFAWSRKNMTLAKMLSRYRFEAADRIRRGLPAAQTPEQTTPKPWEEGYSPYDDPRNAKQYNPLAPQPIPEAQPGPDGYYQGYAKAPRSDQPAQPAAPAPAAQPARAAAPPLQAKKAPAEPTKTAEDTGYESEDTTPRPFPEVELKPEVPEEAKAAARLQEHAPAQASAKSGKKAESKPAEPKPAAGEPSANEPRKAGTEATEAGITPQAIQIPASSENGVPSLTPIPQAAPVLEIPQNLHPAAPAGETVTTRPLEIPQNLHPATPAGETVTTRPLEIPQNLHPAAPAGETVTTQPAEPAPLKSKESKENSAADTPSPGVKIPADSLMAPEIPASPSGETPKPKAAPGHAEEKLSAPEKKAIHGDTATPPAEHKMPNPPPSPGDDGTGELTMPDIPGDAEPARNSDDSALDDLLTPPPSVSPDAESSPDSETEKAAADRRRKEAEERRKAAEARQKASEKRAAASARDSEETSEKQAAEKSKDAPPDAKAPEDPAENAGKKEPPAADEPEEEEPVNVNPAPKPEADAGTQEFSGGETEEMRRILESLESEGAPPAPSGRRKAYLENTDDKTEPPPPKVRKSASGVRNGKSKQPLNTEEDQGDPRKQLLDNFVNQSLEKDH